MNNETTEAAPRVLSETNAAAVALIKRRVALDFRVSPEDLDAPGRFQPIALARQVAMHFTRRFVKEIAPFAVPAKHVPLSYPAIAAAFKRDDHGTAMHACKSVVRRYTEDLTFAARIDRLAAEIGAELKKGRAA